MSKFFELWRMSANLLVLLSIGWVCVANADVYKFVNPVTGAVEYTNQPKRGAQKIGDRKQMKKEARDELNSLYPGACERTCNIEPGMPIGLVILAMDGMVIPDGYSHTAAGKVERFRHGGCRLTVRDDKVTGVFC